MTLELILIVAGLVILLGLMTYMILRGHNPDVDKVYSRLVEGLDQALATKGDKTYFANQVARALYLAIDDDTDVLARLMGPNLRGDGVRFLQDLIRITDGKYENS